MEEDDDDDADGEEYESENENDDDEVISLRPNDDGGATNTTTDGETGMEIDESGEGVEYDFPEEKL